MIEFHPSVHEAVVRELRSGLVVVERSAARLGTALTTALDRPWLLDAVADGVRWCVERLQDLVRATATRVRELAEGAAAPVLFYARAGDWTTLVASPSSAVAASTAPDALRAPLWWSGDAADRYQRAVRGQSPAAAQVVEVGTTVARSLTTCAVAGCAFYLALAWVVGKLVAATIAAATALGSAVLSWAGVLLIVEEAAVSAAVVSAALAALAATQTAAADAVVEVGRAAGSSDGLPRGSWPVGTA